MTQAFNLAELQRQLAHVISLGVISETDTAQQKVKVSVSDMDSGWLPWPCEMGRNYQHLRPLRIGTAVILASPEGNLAHARIIGMYYTDTLKPESLTEHQDRIAFNDGTYVMYDSEQKTLSIRSAGKIHIQADSIMLEGTVTQTGGDMTSQGVSVKNHQHQDSMGGKTSQAQ